MSAESIVSLSHSITKTAAVHAGNHYYNTYEHLLISWHRLCLWASSFPTKLCVCLDTHTQSLSSHLPVPVMEVSNVYTSLLSLSVCECRVNRFSLSQHNQNSSINAGNYYYNTYEHLLISWHRLCVCVSLPFQLNCVCVFRYTRTQSLSFHSQKSGLSKFTSLN